MPLTPTLALSGGGLRKMIEKDAALANDPRFGLYPKWLQATVTGPTQLPPGVSPAALASLGSAGGEMVLGLMRAGTTIVAGTDTPNAATLHGELYTYVLAGMTPFEALRTATVNSAGLLGIDAGSIAPGKLADLAIVDGNPLEDITATARVRAVIANGQYWTVEQLLNPTTRP